jgi:phosphoserine phosphatase RsbU/P
MGVTASRAAPSDAENRLRHIQSIADAALSGMDASQLTALLERVREIMQVDTAAVLLLDPSSGQLIATAASGLEEEVHQGVRVPVVSGLFAGRIAAGRVPVVVDHVGPATVRNPLLLEKKVRSVAGMPLLADGAVLGVLHVGSLDGRKFTARDVQLLQLAADRAAAAVQALTSRSDREAASALQRSLVPPALPRIAGAELAARYVPGTGRVGGDWYDVFVLPSGEPCVVVGDVAGAGLRAAVIMGRMRSTLRSYALETADPADILSRLDRKMQYFEPDAMATVACAVLDPSISQARVSLAGHLPPVLAAPGRGAELAEMAGDLLIGADSSARRRTASIQIPPGALLCLYTDGLVERRDRPLDDGFRELCQAITAGPPDPACAKVMNALVRNGPAADDIALLMLRRLPPEACRGSLHEATDDG